jgi:hypothetical protein
MPSGARAACGKARRLVQDDDMVVLVDDQAADFRGILVRHGRISAAWAAGKP